ncbi:MAG: protein kinase domain-containing protein [Dolichospermum sp.]
MSQCINPNCLHQNPQDTIYCENCGNKILLDDRYHPIKFLGEGGFGRTFQALDKKRFNTPCVIKQFLPQQAGSAALQKATELFQQEGKRLQELGKHSQIPDLFAFFPQDGRLYLVQEFIDGQNLLEELRTQGKLNESQIRILLIELLPVLQFIHDNNIIHRDIKPENIIRSTNGKLFLIDFGVSKETSGSILTRVGTTVGTPGYAPPEQFRGMVYANSDLYSLAVTCIRLLTGYFQQNDGSDELFDTNQMQWTWQKYVSLSQELTNILTKMLQDIPAKRYPSARDILEILGDYPYGNAPKGEYRQQTTNVGSFPPNAFGLYDMHGNVWEWCEDGWHENYINAPVDGTAWTSLSDNRKVLHGGSCIDIPENCRSAYRSYYVAGFVKYNLGFRVVCGAAWTH